MSRNRLRYSSVEDMPPSMRALVHKTTSVGKTEMLLVQNARGCGKATMAATVREIESQGKPGKYRNQVTRVDGIRFDSKREARYYENLKLRKAAGEVSYWLRQVPLHLPGGTRYVVDFLVFFTDGRQPQYVDAKGHETPVFRLKRREIEHHYPIRLVIV